MVTPGFDHRPDTPPKQKSHKHSVFKAPHRPWTFTTVAGSAIFDSSQGQKGNDARKADHRPKKKNADAQRKTVAASSLPPLSLSLPPLSSPLRLFFFSFFSVFSLLFLFTSQCVTLDGDGATCSRVTTPLSSLQTLHVAFVLGSFLKSPLALRVHPCCRFTCSAHRQGHFPRPARSRVEELAPFFSISLGFETQALCFSLTRAHYQCQCVCDLSRFCRGSGLCDIRMLSHTSRLTFWTKKAQLHQKTLRVVPPSVDQVDPASPCDVASHPLSCLAEVACHVPFPTRLAYHVKLLARLSCPSCSAHRQSRFPYPAHSRVEDPAPPDLHSFSCIHVLRRLARLPFHRDEDEPFTSRNHLNGLNGETQEDSRMIVIDIRGRHERSKKNCKARVRA